MISIKTGQTQVKQTKQPSDIYMTLDKYIEERDKVRKEGRKEGRKKEIQNYIYALIFLKYVLEDCRAT